MGRRLNFLDFQTLSVVLLFLLIFSVLKETFDLSGNICKEVQGETKESQQGTKERWKKERTFRRSVIAILGRGIGAGAVFLERVQNTQGDGFLERHGTQEIRSGNDKERKDRETNSEEGIRRVFGAVFALDFGCVQLLHDTFSDTERQSNGSTNR
jgi:hypothetical protein